jgi:hypothetical protein
MAMAANKRSTGVPAGRQTLNDEELVCVPFFQFLRVISTQVSTHIFCG